MPREEARIGHICSLLKQLWNFHHKMEFCDLLATHLFTEELRDPFGDIWFIEDSELEDILKEKVKTLPQAETESKLSMIRLAIIDKLEKLWKKYTDQRLGQLLSNYVVGNASDYPPGQMFSLKDPIVLTRLNN